MRLGKREKTFLLVGIPILVAVLLYRVVYAPDLEKLRDLTGRLPASRGDLQKVAEAIGAQTALQTEIADLKKKIEARGRRMDLFGFIFSIASDLKIKERCEAGAGEQPVTQRGKADLDYKLSSVEVKLHGVSIEELTDFLYRIYSADKLLTVDEIDISVPSSGRAAGLEVEMTVSTLVGA